MLQILLDLISTARGVGDDQPARGTGADLARENVAALETVYAEWRRGNFRERFDLYAPDMEWGWSREFPDLEGVVRDPELRSARLREWLSPWEDWRVEPQEYVAAADRVVVLARYTGRGKGSEVAIESLGAHVWTVREGRAVRLEIFSDREAALRSAGLAAGQPLASDAVRVSAADGGER